MARERCVVVVGVEGNVGSGGDNLPEPPKRLLKSGLRGLPRVPHALMEERKLRVEIRLG